MIKGQLCPHPSLISFLAQMSDGCILDFSPIREGEVGKFEPGIESENLKTGMLEYWNDGMLQEWKRIWRSSPVSIPIFHYSNILFSLDTRHSGFHFASARTPSAMSRLKRASARLWAAARAS